MTPFDASLAWHARVRVRVRVRVTWLEPAGAVTHLVADG